MTTMALGRDGVFYDLGKGEFPGAQWVYLDGRWQHLETRSIVETAFTCTVEEAERLQAGDWKLWKEIRARFHSRG